MRSLQPPLLPRAIAMPVAGTIVGCVQLTRGALNTPDAIKQVLASLRSAFSSLASPFSLTRSLSREFVPLPALLFIFIGAVCSFHSVLRARCGTRQLGSGCCTICKRRCAERTKHEGGGVAGVQHMRGVRECCWISRREGKNMSEDCFERRCAGAEEGGTACREEEGEAGVDRSCGGDACVSGA